MGVFEEADTLTMRTIDFSLSDIGDLGILEEFWGVEGSWYEGDFRDGVQSGWGVLYREGGHREY